MTLTIEDTVSGTVLADVELTAEQSFRLFQGATLHLRNRHPAQDMSHVGLHMHTATIDLPKTATGGVDPGARMEAAREWAKNNHPAHWTEMHVRGHGGGEGRYSMVGHWWDETPDASLQIRVDGES